MFRSVEVVQITEVRRGGPENGARLHGLFEQRRTAAADLSQHEQVVIRLVHAESEMSRDFRPFLADPRRGVFQQF